MEEIYSNGNYLEHNPTWHTEDSPWKAGQILKVLEKNNIVPKSVCEIGSGAGEILNTMHGHLPNTTFTGFEISSDAYNIAAPLEKERLHFVLADLLASENIDFFDVLLVIDVFEHVQDYYTFLRKCKEKATYKIFHIPLEISVQTVFRMNPLIEARKNVGHLHYFSKETALASLKEAGYDIIYFSYTDAPFAVPKSFKGQALNIPRKFLSLFNKDLAVRIFGGYSLIVLSR